MTTRYVKARNKINFVMLRRTPKHLAFGFGFCKSKGNIKSEHKVLRLRRSLAQDDKA